MSNTWKFVASQTTSTTSTLTTLLSCCLHVISFCCCRLFGLWLFLGCVRPSSCFQRPLCLFPFSFFLFLSITATKPSGFNVHGTFVSQPGCTLIAPLQQVSVSKGKVSNATTRCFQKTSKEKNVKCTNNTGGKEPRVRKLASLVDSL